MKLTNKTIDLLIKILLNKKQGDMIMLKYLFNTTTNTENCETNDECKISLFVVVLNNYSKI